MASSQIPPVPSGTRSATKGWPPARWPVGLASTQDRPFQCLISSNEPCLESGAVPPTQISESEIAVIADSADLAGSLGWTGATRQAVPFQCMTSEWALVPGSPACPGFRIVQMSSVDSALTSPRSSLPGSRKTRQPRPLNLAAYGWQLDDEEISDRARQPNTQTSSGPKTLTDCGNNPSAPWRGSRPLVHLLPTSLRYCPLRLKIQTSRGEAAP